MRSPVGRTRTAPAPDSAVAGLRLGIVSCANYEGGFFSPCRHLAARTDLHAVLHLGDYLYEYAPGEYGPGPAVGRTHQPAREMVSLADYRQRHALYKTDADLQALHASVPFIVTWDDHETTNDAWAAGAENHSSTTEGPYAVRKAAARRACDEWMPIRTPDPSTIFRRLQFGRLADLTVLDLRQCRSQQVDAASSGAVDDPLRTITGRAHMDLKAGRVSTSAQWKLVGNPVMITPVVFPPLPASIGRPLADVTGLLPPDGVPYNDDQWDGCTAARRELLSHLQDRRPQAERGDAGRRGVREAVHGDVGREDEPCWRRDGLRRSQPRTYRCRGRSGPGSRSSTKPVAGSVTTMLPRSRSPSS